ESKAPPSHTKAHSHIRPPEKRPDVPITSMDEYNRKLEVKARSAGNKCFLLGSLTQQSCIEHMLN
ncbi:hypothetical protein GOODEAATRI_025996, partial [Goodea atripinnis]